MKFYVDPVLYTNYFPTFISLEILGKNKIREVGSLKYLYVKQLSRRKLTYIHSYHNQKENKANRSVGGRFAAYVSATDTWGAVQEQGYNSRKQTLLIALYRTYVFGIHETTWNMTSYEKPCLTCHSLMQHDSCIFRKNHNVCCIVLDAYTYANEVFNR